MMTYVGDHEEMVGHGDKDNRAHGGHDEVVDDLQLEELHGRAVGHHDLGEQEDDAQVRERRAQRNGPVGHWRLHSVSC